MTCPSMNRFRAGLAAAAVAVVAAAVLSPPAFASPTITEFPAGGPNNEVDNGFPVNPEELTTGPDGNIWYTDGSYVYHMSASGTNVAVITGPDSSVPTSNRDPADSATGIVTDAGDIWYTDGPDIGCIVPGSPPTVQTFAIPVPTTGGTPQADGIMVDRLGLLWFTDVGTNNIDAWSVGSGCVAHGKLEFPVNAQLGENTGTNPLTDADSIAVGPNGYIWFTEAGAQRIGEMSPSGFVVGTFPAPPATLSGGEPLGITAGPDGNLWFTYLNSDMVGRITPGGGVTDYSLPDHGGGSTWSIIKGPDGNLWFTDTGNAVGCINSLGNAALYTTPTSTNSDGITIGPDGNIWFAENTGQNIGRLAPVQCGASTVGTGTPPPSTPPPSTPPPAFGPGGVIGAPPSSVCVSNGTLTFTIHSFQSVIYKQITVYVKGKRVKRLKGRRHKAKIVLRHLRYRKFAIKIVVNSTSWTVTGTRTYQSCS
jgi:streptogramin lyase